MIKTKTKTYSALFAGLDGAGKGLEMAGYRTLNLFEIDAALSAIGAANSSGEYVVADICAVNFAEYPAPDCLWASPVCTRASNANNNKGEAAIDLATAEATIRALRTWMPESFVVENVWGYRHFRSFHTILSALLELGYRYQIYHLNAADYAVPQTRKRLILMASRIGPVEAPRQTHWKTPHDTLFGEPEPSWVGWYEAIEDLLPDLPDAEFAPWQLNRLEGTKFDLERMSSFLSSTQSDGDKTQLAMRGVEMPSYTIMAKETETPRAFLVIGDNASNSTILDADRPSMTIGAMNGRGNESRAFIACGMANNHGDSMTLRGDCEHRFTITAQTGGRQAARAYLVDGDAGGDRPPTVRDAHSPSTVIKANAGSDASIGRALLQNGRVVQLNTRALARLQSFPDSYLFSGHRATDGIGIGNAVPPMLAKAVGLALPR